MRGSETLVTVRARRTRAYWGAWSTVLPAAMVWLALCTLPRDAAGTVSIASWTQHSPDDITAGNIPGLLTLSGNDVTANVTLPFTVTIEGVGYSTITISTNGWIEFGGNTFGNSDPASACLPTSKHTNPFLAAYWHDLQTFGTHIRHGVVGTSPQRVYTIDYEVDVDPAVENNAADDLRFQIQIHEGSNLLNVRYRDTGHLANGQGATIGFQGAGGSGASAQPLTCNGKVMDDNRPNEGWSVDAGRAGLVTLFALMAHSPDDISGFTTLSGSSNTAGVTLPFSITLEGVSYDTLTIGTNGTIQFGTTSGSNPSANTGLPTSSFTNPTIFYYWDDLQTEGGHIRYGTVGSSPNRTFIVDFQENTVASSGNKVNGQVQIHERSNLINVKYRSTLSSGSNGQSATIGFQGAGGASAAAYPLTFDGKVLDDDRPDSGWSIHPKALGAMSLHATIQHSPNDISGFTTLSGDNAVAGVTMPFSVRIDGVNYNTVTIGTNGLIQFGTLSGANPTGNTALPSASFSGPTLFYYWDDLQTEGGHIRYGTVGSSPNRTFIVDFQENTVASSGNKVNGQVQIHEGSNVLNVQYRSTLSAGSNGQSATIGFQGAGGASADAYPLVFNGKILDDNLPDAGWSVAPLPICGNSIIETKEQCDLGGSNGASTTCCTSTCGFRSSGSVCRPSAGACDLADTCTGTSDACPADAKSTAVCRGAASVCDLAETCDGTSDSCPPDVFAPATIVCRGTAGTCDVAESCTGTSGTCPVDQFLAATTVCRGVAGECDVAESCTGSAALCPPDAFEPSTVICRTSAGVCDVAESCTGSGASCPADGKSTGVCRAAAGACDLSESCDGSGNDCPADAKSTGVCRAAAGACDLAESCDGSDDDCPADALRASGFVCNSGSGDLCDPDETCDGSTAQCPADTVASAGTVCRPGSGDLCDPDEVCSGIADDACPSDAVAANGTICRAGSGDACDPDEACSGVAGEACPADVVTAGGTVCRPGSGDLCDPDEVCSGNAGESCPSDVVEPSSTVCRPGSGDLCDPDELCPGVPSGTCAADVVAPATTVCRAGSGDLCDPDELCPGVPAGSCAADVVLPAGTVCNPGSGDLCDPDEVCTGIAGEACPVDTIASPATICRAAAAECDVAETCSGIADAACPADGKASSSTVCRAAAGACDATELCTGTSNTCPADADEPNGTPCSDGLYCNGDETCQAGTCTPGEAPCLFGCSEASESCLTDTCPAVPQTCRTAQKSLLMIKNKDNNDKDKLIWKFIKGEATTTDELAEPRTVADYALCLYSGPSASLVGQIHIPANGTKWSPVGSKGYKYFDQTLAADGAEKVIVKSGVAGKSKALLKGRGANLPDPLDSGILTAPVTVQLINYGTAVCWQGTYGTFTKNETTLFKAKQ